MISQPARIVVIDNEPKHLSALTRALANMGSACLPFLYEAEHPSQSHLASARVIFCDLHLLSDAMTSDNKQQYANIASMLLESLKEEHGPYLLIVWSRYPKEVEDLHAYLEELSPGQQPVLCLCLDKGKFIDIDSGEPLVGTDLPAEISKMFEENPGLSALLQWEQNVSKAASVSTSTLWKLCQAHGDHQDRALRNTLGRLAKGALGDEFARDRPGRGVTEALGPLLADQLEKESLDEDYWKAAVEFDQPGMSASAVELYTYLHIETETNCLATERGVVSSLPSQWISAGKFIAKFGHNKTDILKTFGFQGDKLHKAIKNSSWYLVQINAACDEAQGNPGLLPFCLAAAVPTEITNNTPKGSVWRSKNFMIKARSCRLLCHGSFILGMKHVEARKLQPQFRIRSQLLDLMVQDVRTNSARLGVLEP